MCKVLDQSQLQGTAPNLDGIKPCKPAIGGRRQRESNLGSQKEKNQGRTQGEEERERDARRQNAGTNSARGAGEAR